MNNIRSASIYDQSTNLGTELGHSKVFISPVDDLEAPYLTGLLYSIGALIKFKQHKDNPTENNSVHLVHGENLTFDGNSFQYQDGSPVKIGDGVFQIGSDTNFNTIDASSKNALIVGVDEAMSQTFSFLVTGGSGPEPIFGSHGSDTINASPDDGTIAHVYGGLGFFDPTDIADLIQVFGNGSALVNANGGNDNVDYQAAGAATIFGGAGSDLITVYNEADNIVFGGKGNDAISTFSHGQNIISGGEGKDTISIYGDGNNLIRGGSSDIDPTDGADFIVINGNGDNVIASNGGNDYITIQGNGDNFINTGLGDDIVYGGSGNDTINGGQGFNVLSGGGGADTFVYTAGAHYEIEDFSADDGDKLDLNGDDYTVTTLFGSVSLQMSSGNTIFLEGVTEAEFNSSYVV